MKQFTLRIPWFRYRRPFVAVSFGRWGTQYSWRFRTIWKFGVGCGCVRDAECGHASCRRENVVEIGHWKWWYYNGAWQ